jgi:hypothetical protein
VTVASGNKSKKGVRSKNGGMGESKSNGRKEMR